MSVHLLGGGRDVARCGALLRPFVVEARARADDRPPVIAVLLVLEADDDSSVARFAAVLEAAGAAAASGGAAVLRPSRHRPRPFERAGHPSSA